MLTQIERNVLNNMDGSDYRAMVIALFRDNKATAEQWEAMAQAVLWASDSNNMLCQETVACIDLAILKEETA